MQRSYLLILYVFLTHSAFAEIQFDYELEDPYYINASLFVPLTEDEIPKVQLDKENQIYKLLMKDIFSPRFFLVEASVNPLPILGVWIRDYQNDFYHDADIGEDFNWIEALTEGFEDPYAISFFVGNVIEFTLPNEQQAEAINKGYSGFLVSIGDQHIRHNMLYDDNWMEIEWKLKGDRRIGANYLSWSYRIGSKLHDNPDIRDSIYLGVRRELFDRELRHYEFLKNTGIDFRIDMNTGLNHLIQSQFLIEKQWPNARSVLSLSVGVKRTSGKYRGALTEPHQSNIILRPKILF